MEAAVQVQSGIKEISEFDYSTWMMANGIYDLW